MEINNKLKEIGNKSYMCYCFDDIIKFEDFDNDKILVDEKLDENILVYNISWKLWWVLNLFYKIDGFIRGYDRTRYLVLFGDIKNMISFTTELDIS